MISNYFTSKRKATNESDNTSKKKVKLRSANPKISKKEHLPLDSQKMKHQN